MIREHPRVEEIGDLEAFVTAEGHGFMYVRGRRRVGKSWVLERLANKRTSHVLLFVGKKDLNATKTIREFSVAFDAFVALRGPSQNHLLQQRLSDLSDASLSWERVFLALGTFLEGERTRGAGPVALVVDEIQWVAREGSGFVGSIKAHWDRLKKHGNFKIILCGSSNKFFEENAGGEEQILRGLKTRSDVWIHPLSPGESARAFFPSWHAQEVACAQMYFGGIPHYLHQVTDGLGFVHAINEACFLESSIFLEEVDELLNLDFNAQRRAKAKQIIRAIPSNGCLERTISGATGLAHTTVSEIVDKLVAYGLLQRGPSVRASKKGPPSTIILIADPFLAFYAHVLSRFEEAIRRNRTGRNLFGERVLSNPSNYYIESYSGEAFERMTQLILERGCRGLEPSHTDAPIFTKLRLTSPDHRTFRHTSHVGGQLDLVVEDRAGRVVHIIECKWGRERTEWIEEVEEKSYEGIRHGQTLAKALLCGYPLSDNFTKSLGVLNVKALSLDDLMDKKKT